MDALTWSEVRDLVELGTSGTISELIGALEEYRERVGDHWEPAPSR